MSALAVKETRLALSAFLSQTYCVITELNALGEKFELSL